MSEQNNRTRNLLRWIIPNGGTILIVILLLITQSAWANVANLTQTASTNTINYQGRIADSGGNPITDVVPMTFRLYTQPTGGVPIWEESWIGGNAVSISDGLFNVMLGSIESDLATQIQDQNELYLGIEVDSDSEMVPRVQLGSVPFAMQSLTVPDGSITAVKLDPELDIGVPDGSIVMWSGAINNIPDGWALCDGSNGTPDLRNRFIVGAGSNYAVGNTGGANQVTLTVGQMPAHNHPASTDSAGQHSHRISDYTRDGGGSGTDVPSRTNKTHYGMHTQAAGAHTHNVTVGNTGGNQPHENRPPYLALAYIMKVAD